MADFLTGRDPGDEDDHLLKDLYEFQRALSGPWTPGFPGVPRGTSQPELNIPPFYPEHRNGADCHADCGCNYVVDRPVLLGTIDSLEE